MAVWPELTDRCATPTQQIIHRPRKKPKSFKVATKFDCTREWIIYFNSLFAVKSHNFHHKCHLLAHFGAPQDP
jgi:hypothetical protein